MFACLRACICARVFGMITCVCLRVCVCVTVTVCVSVRAPARVVLLLREYGHVLVWLCCVRVCECARARAGALVITGFCMCL